MDFVHRYEYDAFGNILATTANGSSTIGNLNPFRFSNEYWDRTTDLVVYKYRYYSPEIGRFLNRDPIEEQGGINLFVFVDNNPSLFYDELGLKGSVSARFETTYKQGNFFGSVSFNASGKLGQELKLKGNAALGGFFKFTDFMGVGNPLLAWASGELANKLGIVQEIRIGVKGAITIKITCPENERYLRGVVDEARVGIYAQARVGYQGPKFRFLGLAEGGGYWDWTTGETGGYLSGSVRIQRLRKKGNVFTGRYSSWEGFEGKFSRDFASSLNLGAPLANKGFKIRLHTTCKCVGEDLDVSRQIKKLLR